MRVSVLLSGALLLAWLGAGCDPPPAETPSKAAVAPSPNRAPVFVDRTKQATFERGQARLGLIRQTLLSPDLTPARTTGLGFECASLRSDRNAVAKEPDPLIGRFVADVDKTCGLDVPLAAAYAELRAIDARRATGASYRSECASLKVALSDFAPKYLSNPVVTTVGGKFATFCASP